MNDLREFLQGKKTYLVAAGFVLAALLELANGASLFAVIDTLLTGLGFGAVRAGITNEAAK